MMIERLTMKTVLVLRHAKSSWDEPGLLDFDRPLNKRGKREAPLVGAFLRQNDLVPDQIISSAARRAAQTVKALVKTAQYEGPVDYHERFYEADADVWLDELAALSDDVFCVLLVGHNPTLEELVFTLSGTAATLATAALAEIALQVDSWAELIEEPGSFPRGTLINVHRPGKADITSGEA